MTQNATEEAVRAPQTEPGLSHPAAGKALIRAANGSPPVALPVKSKWRLSWRRVALIIAVALIGSGAGYYWLQRLHPGLPLSIVSGNGRLESDEINIDTKYAGRIAEMLADEGDLVKAGQVVARMDTRDLQASLKKSEAQVQQARRAVDEANANVTQQHAQAVLAQQEYDRAGYLVAHGFQTKEVLDQRQQQLDGANAALSAAKLRAIEFEHALDAATHDVELYSVEIDDDTLVTPREGRLQYRIANLGEVLPAGGHVFAMLDTAYVYMDIYLPTEQAGKVKYGAEARVVTDAFPKVSIPAKVTFIATQAQFTPKTVETKTERDKLMFRVRVRIDADWLRGQSDAVSSGLPGVAYVQTDAGTPWPAALEGTAVR